MAKLDSIIKIINLLNHRRSMTLEAIVKECNISERTAYRYLNTISEANVPVYFNQELRAYTLSDQWRLSLDDLRMDELVVLGVALRTLSVRVNASYEQSLHELTKKVFARQLLALDDLWELVGRHGDSDRLPTDFSEFLTQVTIHMASRCGKTIELQLLHAVNGSRSIVIERPVLRFSNGWRVVSQAEPPEKAIPLAEISMVQAK